MKKMLLVLMMMSVSGWAMAVGPAPATSNLYGAPGITMVDNETQISGLIGYNSSWAPMDIVVEGVIRERTAVHLLLSKQFGDIRALAGIGLNSSASSGLVMGADYKRVLVRLGSYSTNKSCGRHCSGKKNHTALFVGYSIPIDAK